MNFFEACANNSASLEGRFQAHISSLEEGERNKIERFAGRVKQEGRIAINIRPTNLLDFLSFERFLNIHQWADVKANRSSKNREALMQDKLGEYYAKRIAFDQHFENGQEFKSGALSIGGMGATKYGEYCIRLRSEVAEAWTGLGYLQSDSLNYYLTDDLRVDEAKLKKSCATHSHKHLLAALKHAAQIGKTEETHWPNMLSNNDEYIEAIYSDKLYRTDVEAVGISETDYDLCFEYSYNEFQEKLGDEDRYFVETFGIIDEYLYRLGIRWEKVKDA